MQRDRCIKHRRDIRVSLKTSPRRLAALGTNPAIPVGMRSPILFAAPLFLSSLTGGFAQSTGLPSEVIVEFAPDPPPASSANPVQARLSATIRPVGSGSRARGELVFIPGGDQVMMLGRIRGLERNKRYEWHLLPAGAVVSAANPLPRGANLGMWTSDSRGFILVDTILPRNTLMKFPAGLVGGTVLIRRAPPLDPPAERPAVAAAEIRARQAGSAGGD